MERLDDIPEPPKIRVVVRKRPLTSREGTAQDIVDVEGVGGLIVKEIKYVSQPRRRPLSRLLLKFKFSAASLCGPHKNGSPVALLFAGRKWT
jgi:hypothetical protein